MEGFACFGLQLAGRRRQDSGERVSARAGYEQGDGDKQLREGIFDAAGADVKAMRKMDEKDGSEHDDADADCADANQDAGENGDAARDLSESDEVADDAGRMHEGSEAVWAGTAECAKMRMALPW